MIPILDDNPTRRRPLVNWAFIAACIAVYVLQINLSAQRHNALLDAYGFIPVTIFGSSGDAGFALVPDWSWTTLVTSMFLHGGLLHLGGNLLYLWIFGNNVEEAMGHARYFLFYLSVGVLAAATEGVVNSSSTVPMVGASGAISGVLAAYVLVFPRARVTVVVPLGVLLYPMKISALFVVLFWFAIQVLQGLAADPETQSVAFWAHIGGFVTGAALTPFFSRFPLYGRRRIGPWN